MRHSRESQRLYGITRSKGKMFELDVPVESHIAIPPGSVPEKLFLLTVGTLGDCAAQICLQPDERAELDEQSEQELQFAASFFDAYLSSRFTPALDEDVALLASATYYLANRPGSSLVLARRLDVQSSTLNGLETFVWWALQADWTYYWRTLNGPYGEQLCRLSEAVVQHFVNGTAITEALDGLRELRILCYTNGMPKDLLLIDLAAAILKRRFRSSSWRNLPVFTGISAAQWTPVIQTEGFPKELWPSQMLLGQEGLFSGRSGLIQMPTSAGKTRSVEIVIRSSFLSGRSRLAVVVAPFRALCHEISNSLRSAFANEAITVDEISDALQADYPAGLEELLGGGAMASLSVLVLTPEKLLYILRQEPSLLDCIGLVVYDEGHQFDTGSRGVTYELLLTEISRLLPEAAQTVLISAVIQNADAIGQWLIGDEVGIVRGTGLSPTARSIAFAHWAEAAGQLMFFESGEYANPDYFVPRVIEQHRLQRKKGERTDRVFPEKGNSNDIALHLGLRLVGKGAVAIFCGRKDTAANFMERGVEIYSRGFNVPAPATYSDSEEIERFVVLMQAHFGQDSMAMKAAQLGLFSHHGNTPQGVRLAVEYAMQKGLIRFVACTSTLAQGVNLPIRYLIVSGLYQGTKKIEARDFQNLMGRAGRAGMHTEGMVVFSDPALYASRRRAEDLWKFQGAVDLLDPDGTGPTSSSLLGIILPIALSPGRSLPIEPIELVDVLLGPEDAWDAWARGLAQANIRLKVDHEDVLREMRNRRRLIAALESYLMAHRGDRSFEEFLSEARRIASETLAYSLATEQEQEAVVALFLAVASYVNDLEPDLARQAWLSKTLMSVKAALELETWVDENRVALLAAQTGEDFLKIIWSVLERQVEDKLFTTALPEGYLQDIALLWMAGYSYQNLFRFSIAKHASKPYGKKRTAIKEPDILGFCEGTMGYDCPLIVAAVTQFLFDDQEDEAAKPILQFHKSMKYGLPDPLSVSCFEWGLADRVIAQHVSSTLKKDGYQLEYFDPSLEEYHGLVGHVLTRYPSYFESLI